MIGYDPFDRRLTEPSSAPLRIFYMYRAVDEEAYPPLNVNAGNLAGVLWYLHHEVVIQYPRKFSISKIVRYKIHMRATQPLVDMGMEFSMRQAYDKGQCTGPFVCGRESIDGGILPKFCDGAYQASKQVGPITDFAKGEKYGGPYEWRKFGYAVGCNKLGGFPFPEFPVYYPGAVWYSLPGPCPSKVFNEHTPACAARDPGGFCKGIPTGAGDCTWNYELVGEISLDELVGMSAAEISRNGREYNPDADSGIQFSWWNGINESSANARRLKEARALFAAKYPSQEKDEDLEPPPCDFNYGKFYKEFYRKDPRSGKCAEVKPGSACDEMIRWGMTEGIVSHPEWFPMLTPESSYEEFHRLLYVVGKAECPHRPCYKNEKKV